MMKLKEKITSKFRSSR